MARWKLTSKHYIYAEQWGEPTSWVREETNKETGRTFRKTFKVPLYIDPEDPISINRFEGFCVVAYKGSEKPGDIVFEGPPTPDMEPLDAEAEARTDLERPKWVSPVDGLPMTVGEDFGAKLLSMLESQINAAHTGRTDNVSLKGASVDEIVELKAMLAQQQETINKLLARDATPQDEVVLENIDPDAPAPMPPPAVAPRRPTIAPRRA